jgi:translation initiation factor 3 subunit A
LRHTHTHTHTHKNKKEHARRGIHNGEDREEDRDGKQRKECKIGKILRERSEKRRDP